MRLRFILFFLALAIAQCVCSQPSASGPFDALLKSGNAHFKANEDAAALIDSQKAIELDSKRYEGYALAALIQLRQGKLDEAQANAAKALELGPEERKTALIQLRDSIAKAKMAIPSNAQPETLSPDDMRKFSALKLILEDADKAGTPDERGKYLEEFEQKSAVFAKVHTNYMQIWELKAAVALEQKNAEEGWEAGRQLLRLGASQITDERMSRLMAKLERNGWLEAKLNKPVSLDDYRNALSVESDLEWKILRPFVAKILDAKNDVNPSELAIARKNLQDLLTKAEKSKASALGLLN